MKKTDRTDYSVVKKTRIDSVKLTVIFILLSLLFMGGCNGSDDLPGSIGICNFDSRGYYIEICRTSDDRVLDSFYLEKWYHLVDNCEAVYDLQTGNYYIVFYEEDTDEKKYSETFYLGDGEFEEFSITENGYIERN